MRIEFAPDVSDSVIAVVLALIIDVELLTERMQGKSGRLNARVTKVSFVYSVR